MTCRNCINWNKCVKDNKTRYYGEDAACNNVEELCTWFADNKEYLKVPETGIGDLSDGWHTFNELYHHRAILFSVICNAFPEKAWKSKKHHEGDMFEGMFIVGIETPEGQATYHYNIEPYWDMFKVKELDIAPWWDRHSADEAINRIGNLINNNYSSWVFEGRPIHCKECGFTPNYSLNKENSKFCPGCGKEMK